ncbi:MAG: hypothetical protein V1853_01605 [bacterium]
MSEDKERAKRSDLLFRDNPECGEKIVFFTVQAIECAVSEGRIPKKYGHELIQVLSHPDEEAAVLEWNGLAQARRSEQSAILVQEVTLKKLLGSRWSH